MSLDVAAYFDRIGFRDEPAPTLATLQAIHRLHPEAIAFENLNPLFGLPVKLELEALQDKLVRSRRGGYCFEHNLLLAAVLEHLGFRVTRLAARVLWGQPDDAQTARGHMLLAVEAGGRRYLADVGFGGQVLTGPLLLEPGLEQATPHESFRLITTGDHLRMQALIDGAWKTLYRFDLSEHFLSDYEVANYYLSTHPGSHFVTGLIAARTEPGLRHALRNNRLAVHHTGGPTEQRVVTSAAELRDVLAERFHLDVPETPRTGEILARLTAGS